MGAGCAWRGCDRSGTLLVLEGARPGEAEHHGPYCVSHAAIACAELRLDRPGPYWFDWVARQRGRAQARRPDVKGAESPS